MSGLSYSGNGRCTVKHPFTPTDLKNLAHFVFGTRKYSAKEIGRFLSRMGPVSISCDGNNGAVWQVGKKQLVEASDFREIMSVVPFCGNTYNGDHYLVITLLGKRQYLVVPFQCDDLLWFRSEKELLAYYEQKGSLPSKSILYTRPKIVCCSQYA